MPPNGAQLCTAAYSTLQSIVVAEIEGRPGRIHALVPVQSIASRIIASGKQLRTLHTNGLHVAKDLTLNSSRAPWVGAQFYILGKNSGGLVKQFEIVYLKPQNGRLLVYADNNNQTW